MSAQRRPLAAALLAAAALAACSSGGTDDVEERANSARLPAIAFVGDDPTPGPLDFGTERRVGLRLDPGGTARLEITSDAERWRSGDRIALDVRVDGSKQDRAAVRLVGDSTTAADRTALAKRWTTLTFVPRSGETAWDLAFEPTRGEEFGLFAANPRVLRYGAEHDVVVLIVSDTHRWDHLSAMGEISRAKTPALDRLARRGGTFTNCYTSTNITNPSHISLMTGIHLRDTRIADNGTPLHESATTLAERFQAAGYQTFGIVSAPHLRDAESGLGQGFDRFEGPIELVRQGGRDGALSLALARKWVAQSRGAPLFLFVHVFDAHSPYDVAEDRMGELTAGRPDPRVFGDVLQMDPERTPAWVTMRGYRDAPFVSRLYSAEIEDLDDELAGLFEEPHLSGATIAFTSDHGEALGERGILWQHGTLQNATVHVPLIVVGDGIAPLKRTNQPVRQIDLAHTLIAMAGLEAGDFPGRDLREALDEEQPLVPRFALGAGGVSASIESDGWFFEMYLKEYTNKSTKWVYPMGACYLFHIEDDPRCTENLAADEFERSKRMRARLLQWLSDAESTGLHPTNYEVPPEAVARLKALGYSGRLDEVLEWWNPEARDAEWTSNPLHLAFEGDGDADLLRDALVPDRIVPYPEVRR
ncbi:MAG: sulfatase [Planctomycetota bacterium]